MVFFTAFPPPRCEPPTEDEKCHEQRQDKQDLNRPGQSHHQQAVAATGTFNPHLGALLFPVVRADVFDQCNCRQPQHHHNQ